MPLEPAADIACVLGEIRPLSGPPQVVSLARDGSPNRESDNKKAEKIEEDSFGKKKQSSAVDGFHRYLFH